jgi:hypothetical protein
MGTCCLPVEILVRAVYLQKYGTWQLPAELWQASLLSGIWHVLPTCRSIVFANYLHNFDKRRHLQKSGMCSLPAEVFYLITTCRNLTGVATCRNLICAVYLQKIVFASYLQNFDKRLYLQKPGMYCLPAEVWYLTTTCRTLTSVATRRNLV